MKLVKLLSFQFSGTHSLDFSLLWWIDVIQVGLSLLLFQFWLFVRELVLISVMNYFITVLANNWGFRTKNIMYLTENIYMPILQRLKYLQCCCLALNIGRFMTIRRGGWYNYLDTVRLSCLQLVLYFISCCAYQLLLSFSYVS